jgi:flagellar hook-basal body complex protein FliE
MQAQKADCNAIIQSKSELIAHIKKDLKTIDNDFAKLLKQQMDDMNQMLKAMSDQLENMSAACR